MAKKNPAHMFRGKKRAYTRKEYIGGVPASRITQFDVGDKIADFSVEVTLSAKEECLVRHNALESARVTANRYIQTHAGRDGYHLKVRTYPHHVLRHRFRIRRLQEKYALFSLKIHLVMLQLSPQDLP